MKKQITSVLAFMLLCFTSFAQTADHSLSGSNLPSNGAGTVSTQMSTVQSFGFVANYYTGSSSINTYIEAVRVYKGLSTTQDAIDYINNGTPELGMASFIEWWEFREAMFYLDTNTIEDAIDLGHPLVAIYIGTSYNYVVMITGYNNNGTVEFFDPTTGYYATAAATAFYTPYEVTGVK